VNVATSILAKTSSNRGTGLGINSSANQLATSATGLPAVAFAQLNTTRKAASSANAAQHLHNHAIR
jgi:hypothetical protein